MGLFKMGAREAVAQRELNTYTAEQIRSGNHEETDEFVRLNTAVHTAVAQDRAERGSRRS